MKRFTLSMVMTAVLGLAAYTLSGAQGPGAGPDTRLGPGPRRPSAFAQATARPALRGADLTDRQRAEIRALREAERTTAQGPPADVRLHRALEAELYADTPDPQKIDALRQQVLDAQAARLTKEIEISQKVAQVLTAEQRAKVRDRLTAAAPQRAPRRGPGVKTRAHTRPEAHL